MKENKNVIKIHKNNDVMFSRRRNACRKVEGFPVLHDKRVKGFKEKDTVQKMPGRK